MSVHFRFMIIALPMAMLACGKGGSSSGPVEPPPPDIGANVVASSTVAFGLCTVPGAGCSYSQEYTNTGQGCANTLRGKVRIFHEESLLETDDWWLDSTFVIRPGQSTPVEDCCFDEDTVRQGTRTVTETFWNNVPCS